MKKDLLLEEINKINRLIDFNVGDIAPLVNESESINEIGGVPWGGGITPGPVASPVSGKRSTNTSSGNNATPGQQDLQVVKGNMNIPGQALFKIGSNVLNKTSDYYKKSISELKRVIQNGVGQIDVTILGGASAVGSNRGFDNNALAKRRADAYDNAIKTDLGSGYDKLTIKKNGIVGKETVVSDKSRAEQFVKVSYKSNVPKADISTQVDTTATKNINAEIPQNQINNPSNPQNIKFNVNNPLYGQTPINVVK